MKCDYSLLSLQFQVFHLLSPLTLMEQVPYRLFLAKEHTYHTDGIFMSYGAVLLHAIGPRCNKNWANLFNPPWWFIFQLDLDIFVKFLLNLNILLRYMSFYPDFLETHFIQILSWLYLNKMGCIRFVNSTLLLCQLL